jgi:hypothetical protein
MTGIMAALAGGKRTVTSSGTMTAAFDAVSTLTGYASAGLAPNLGTSTFGGITGASSAFGTVEGLYSLAGVGQVVFSSTTGGPSTISIDGDLRTLSFAGSSGGYDTYTISGSTAFVNATVYNWIITN